MHPLDKQTIRKTMLQRRQTLSAGEVEYRSQRVFQNFLEHVEEILPRTYHCVGLYYPIRGEVDTRPFFHYFKSWAKKCLFPKVETNCLGFYEVGDWSELQICSFGIGEPQVSPGIVAVKPDVVIVPGVSFSKDAHRLGFGAGYYDRTVNQWADLEAANDNIKAPCLIGISYDFQVLPELPSEDHDFPMDFVVTDQELIGSGRRCL